MTTVQERRGSLSEYMLRTPAVGPTIALVVAVVVFSFATDTFFNVDNLSLVVQQSLVIGTLALGQTLVILTGGIDLANAAIAVLATLIMAKYTLLHHVPGIVTLILGVVVAAAISGVSGDSFVHFLLALTLNGIGWNFLYLAGTTLLVRCYPRGRGGRIQAVAEGVGSVTGVAASLSASTVFYFLGWQGTNIPVLTIATALFVVLTIAAVRAKDDTPPAEDEPAPVSEKQLAEQES
ncbi:hypothetical protein ACFQ1S_16365 [Kibdelosporangium lantanae]|uniref:Major facilitator superfamily (MFS) profile domain-containing protein n=1 Tax=Kibdelosporangium lantanae TaxID=1497396 RepID=A0ABW3M9H5_9PSEU